MIDKLIVNRLVIQSGGRLKETRPFEFQGIIYHPSESYYFDSSMQLRKFSQAVIEDYKASLVPVAYRFDGNYCIKVRSLSFDKPINKLHLWTSLYALGETK